MALVASNSAVKKKGEIIQNKVFHIKQIIKGQKDHNGAEKSTVTST